jgi:DNA polymerase III subunit alpha
LSLAVTHLHVHSYYSFLEGLASPRALAQAAAADGMESLALTDSHGLTGAVEFYDACRAAGVRPIIGLELAVVPPAGWLGAAPGSLVLLAQSLEGWASLCRLSTAVQTRPERDPTLGLPFDGLAADAAGLLCLTGGARGLASRLIAGEGETAVLLWLGALREVFGDRLYVELAPAWDLRGKSSQAVSRGLAALARQARLPVVATNDVHMLRADEAELQRTQAAMRLIQPLAQLPAEAAAPPGTHFLTQREMLLRWAEFPEAVGRSAEVADRCRLELPLGVPHYPDIPLPPGQTAAGALRDRAEAGARRLYGEPTPEIQARLEHELAVIGERGYAPLFLIMAEIMAYARSTGVPTSSRGSAASSLVAHCLDITTPDPIRLNLYFERFLNPARTSPPDIDTDLCSRRRDGVIQHVYDQYGAERVAMVCTIMRFRERSALREVAKAHGLPPAEVKRLADALPYRYWGPLGAAEESQTNGHNGALETDLMLSGPYAMLAREHNSELHRAIFSQAAALLGVPRHLSVHPGGVVIAPGPMTDLAPRQLASKGIVVTQLDLGSIARLGLIKIDLLGIRGLTVLGDLAVVIARSQSTRDDGDADSASALAALEAIPDRDPPTRELVRAGRTIGCFQIESPGMRATLKEVGAQSIDDLMLALALYRPGPLMGGLKEAFVRRHLGREPVAHLHPALAPLLDDTYGVILYQEQVLRIAHELAGLTLAEADLLRRAMSHFDPGQQMQTLKQRFMAGAEAKHQVPAVVSERVWELMAAFSGYGFPKAHAASYALVGWRAAWCKAHFPAHFMAAVLANWGGYYSQGVYLTEARRLGLALRPPHVNYARREFSVTTVDGRPCLFMGLGQVRELTRQTQQRILRARPFHSLAEFLARVDPRPQEVANLVRVGALAGLGTIPALLDELKATARQPGQLSLFAPDAGSSEEWPLAERVAAQQALLGASVDAHPLELVSERIAKAGALTTVAAAGRLGQVVRVAGTRQSWRRTRTVRGDTIYFMAFEDLEGMLDVVIFGDVYRRYRSALSTGDPLVLEGRVDFDPRQGEPVIRAERIWPLV